jgi:hypothetical protein
MATQRKNKDWIKKMSRQVLVLAVSLFFIGATAPLVYAWIITISISYTPVTTGGYTTISWSAPTSDVCSLLGPTLPLNCSAPTCFNGVTVAGESGSVYTGPINGSTYYTINCHNVSGGIGSSEGNGSNSLTVVPGASCAVSSFSSPWNSASYLIYSGGQGSISNCRYCVTNYSGAALFIPMATAAEWNNFVARAAALSVGIVAY